MRIGAVVAFVLVVAAASAAAWFALREPPADDPGRDAPAAAGPDAAAGKPAGARDEPRARARAPGAWTKHGEGTVMGLLREHSAERPLAGVEVELAAGDDGPAVTLRATSAADGAFRFEHVPDFGGWTFRARVKEPKIDIEQGGVSVLPDRTTDLGVIYAVAPAALSGIVVDQAGAPVGGAEVSVLRTFRLDKIRGVSDMLGMFFDAPVPVDHAKAGADGKFRLTHTPPGAFEVVADGDGFSRGTEHVSLIPGAEPAALKFVLAPGHAITGRVLRKSDAAGRLDGVRVRAAPADGFSMMPWDALSRVVVATSDAAGAFRLPGLAAGKWELMALSAGEMSSDTVRIDVPHEAAVEIEIGGSAVVAGKVTGPGDVPVAEARIIVALTGAGQRVATTTSAKDGTYEVRGLPSGDDAMVIAEARGFAPSADMMAAMREDPSSRIRLVPGVNPFDVQLAAGGTLVGRVVEKGTERGIDGVHVSVRGGGFMAIFGLADTFTGVDGRFELRGLAAGKLAATLEKAGWYAAYADVPGANPFFAGMMDGDDPDAAEEPDSGQGLTIVAAEGITVQRTLEMHAATVVAGRVMGEDGAAVAGARVRVNLPKGEMGDFDLSDLLGGMMGNEDEGARVTDAAGAFELTAPPGKAFTVDAKAGGFVDGKSAEQKGEAGARIEGVVVTLSRGATLEGVVTAPGGAPVADAAITWSLAVVANEQDPLAMMAAMRRTMGPSQPAAATTGPDGRFRVVGVTPGKVGLTVRRTGFRTLTRDGIDAVSGATATVDVALDRGAAVTGTVIDESGRPVAKARVKCTLKGAAPNPMNPFQSGSADRTGSAVTGDDGAFRVEGLGPGSYTVRARGDGLIPSAAVDGTADGAAVLVRVTHALDITGFVRCDGKPVGGVAVTASSGAPPATFDSTDFDATDFDVEDFQSVGVGGSASQTKDDGSFELKGLAPGEYRLTATPADGGGANILRTVSNGVAAGTRGLTIDCKAGLVIAGTVTLADGSRAKSGSVQATRHGAGATRAVPSPTTPAPAVARADENAEEGFDAESWVENPSATIQDGAFRIVGLEPGEYDLEVTVDAAGKARATVAAGAADVRLRLPPSGTVSGRVLLAGGKPVTWASVQIQASGVKDSAPVENAMTNRTGRFTFHGVAEGSWT